MSFFKFKGSSSGGENSSLMEHDSQYNNTFQRALRDAIRSRSTRRKVGELDNVIKRTRFDKLKALVGRDDSDKILLIRRHEHLIEPLRNDMVSRRRWFTHGTVTAFILVGCLVTGYSYARLQQDEVLRRLFYNRYANFITLFDTYSSVFERLLLSMRDQFQAFDSSYFYWYFKTSKMAEFRAYRKLEGEIMEKQALQGDEVSKAILEIEKELKV